MDKAEAVANAARIITDAERDYDQLLKIDVRTHLDLAKAWTELARVIGGPDD